MVDAKAVLDPALLRGLTLEQAIWLYAELESGLDPEAWRETERWLGRNDLFYLLAYLCGRKDMVHPWIYARCREVEAAPDGYLDLWFREGYKSTIISFGKTIQDILVDPEITIGIFSHTRPIAKAFLRQIKQEFERNDKLKALYPEILWADPQREAQPWGEDVGIVVKRKSNAKEPIDCNEPVLTTRGWKRHGDLVVGDRVFGPDGKSTAVVAVSETWSDLPCYRVVFGDHSVIAAGTHLWEASRWHRSREMKRAGLPAAEQFEIYTTEELKDQLRATPINPPAVRVPCPLQIDHADLAIDPYVLGCWLGDGSKNSARFVSSREDFKHFSAEMQKAGHSVHIYYDEGNKIQYQLDKRDRTKICRRGHDMAAVGVDTAGRCKACNADRSAPYTVDGLSWRLRRLGLQDNKHVPEQYLLASKDQRLALLQGLMDTDGCCSTRDGCAIFANTNERLADAVHFLAVSLGMKARIKRRERPYRGVPHVMWWVTFVAHADYPPFRMRRKIENCSSAIYHPRRTRHVLTAVEPVEPRPVSCIQVDNESGCYLVGKALLTTHNSTVEAWGLVDGQPTGRHFRLRVYDDVVTRESTTTPDQVEKTTKAWELSDNLGAQGGRVRYIGTRYNVRDSYADMMARGVVKVRIKPATDNGRLDGKPVLFTEEEWAAKKRLQSSTVAAQHLQNPLAGTDMMFQGKWLTPWEVRSRNLNVYILCDPSMGVSATSDRTAMPVIAYAPGGSKFLVDGYCHRMSLSDRWQKLRDLHKKWKRMPGVQTVQIGYEKYGMQSDTTYFRERMRLENYSFPLQEVSWTREGGQSKIARIERLEPDIRLGQFRFPALVWHEAYPGNLASWRFDESTGQIVYDAFPPETEAIKLARAAGIPIPAETRAMRVAREAGTPDIVVAPIKQIDEERRVYDLTRIIIDELLTFSYSGSFSQHEDGIDACSRIYDMAPIAPNMQAVADATPTTYYDS